MWTQDLFLLEVKVCAIDPIGNFTYRADLLCFD